MIRKKIYSVIVTAIMMGTTANAGEIELKQIPPITHFEHHQINPNILSKNIHTILQDAHGFMWFFTYHDIFRYDGIRFLPMMRYIPEIVSNSSIITVYQDPLADSLVYLATQYDVVRINLDNFLQPQPSLRINKIYPVEKISQIFKDSKKRIWLTASAYSISMINPDTDSLAVVIDLNARKKVSIGTFEEVESQAVFNITRDGTIYKFNEHLREFELYYKLSGAAINRSFSYDQIRKLLWLGTTDGRILSVNLNKKTFKKYSLLSSAIKKYNTLENIFSDNGGKIWITVRDQGLFQFDPENQTVQNYQHDKKIPSTLHSNRVLTIFDDFTGLKWISYDDGFVSHFRIQKQSIDNYGVFDRDKGESARPYSAIYIGENKFIVTYQKGLLLIQYDDQSKSYSIIKNHIFPPKIMPSALVSGSDGKIWIGTLGKGTIWVTDKDLKDVRRLELPLKKFKTKGVIDLMLAQNNSLWICTLSGWIIEYDVKNKKFSPYKINPERINSIKVIVYCSFEESDQSILIGTNQGLYRFLKTESRFKKLTLRNDQGEIHGVEKISEIQKAPSGELLLNSSSGIFSIQKQDTVAFLKTDRSLLGIGVRKNIVVDSLSTVWLISKSEIIRMDENWHEILKLSGEDGLIEGGLSQKICLLTPWGDLIFGKARGLSVLHTDEIDQNQNIPKIIISDFKAYNESVTIGSTERPTPLVNSQKHEYDYRTNIFKIEFSLLDFSRPERHEFAYRMLGLNPNWTALKNSNFVTFINLPPKEYRFEIKGKSSKGMWSKNAISISIVIHPPFWQTWWFWSLVISIIFALVWALNYQRLKRVHRRNVQLELINKELSEQISIREKMENMLRESEEKYRMLVSSIQQDIFTCDEDGNLHFINEVVVHRTGRNPNDLVGKPVTEIYPDFNPYELQTNIADALNSRTGMEVDLQSQNGYLAKYLHFSLQPLKSNLSPKKMILGIVTDLSEQRRLEEELRQSQKLEAVGKLAGGIAHDFNNLIAVIRGYSDLLLSEFHGDQETLENIQEIDKASDRAAVLVRQLLAFGRRQMLELQVVNINDVFQNLENMLSRLIPENIELWVHRDPDLYSVYADSGQLEQVIINLFVNARDAMPNGGKLSVRIKNMNITAEKLNRYPQMILGDYVLLEVADTGIGIPEDIKEKIFEPFFTTKKKGEGTGLGLSTVFGIIKQSGGYVFVDSKPGNGTLFSVLLPRTYKKTEEISAAKTSFSPKIKGGGETILVAEDEDGLRKMITKMLKKQKYKVLAGADGKQALKEWQAHAGKVDLVLTDVVMPGLNGRELVEQIRMEQKDIAVLYMSGYTDDQLVQQEILQENILYIQKPFTPQALSEKIKSALLQNKIQTIEPDLAIEE